MYPVEKHINDQDTVQPILPKLRVVKYSKFIDGNAISSQTPLNMVQENEEDDINKKNIEILNKWQIFRMINTLLLFNKSIMISLRMKLILSSLELVHIISNYKNMKLIMVLIIRIFQAYCVIIIDRVIRHRSKSILIAWALFFGK